LRVCGGQISARHGQGGIVVDGLLEVVDGFFVASALVRLNPLIQLIAGLEFLAPGRRNQQREGCGGYHRKACNSVHSVSVLLRAPNTYGE
jgi:hypothetical protein